MCKPSPPAGWPARPRRWKQVDVKHPLPLRGPRGGPRWAGGRGGGGRGGARGGGGGGGGGGVDVAGGVGRLVGWPARLRGGARWHGSALKPEAVQSNSALSSRSYGAAPTAS